MKNVIPQEFFNVLHHCFKNRWYEMVAGAFMIFYLIIPG